MITVLYVDDEPGMREVAQTFLEEAGGFEFTAMASAKKALESPEILSYDAIVSDYMMPGMDGIAFLKAIRQRSADIPFILFTGRGREQVVIEAINNGADFYLQKGGDPDAQFAELGHKIKQAVARRRAEQQRTESEKRLLDIIDFLPDPTFAIDRAGRVIAWNRAMEEMTGKSPEDMLGKGDYEYAVPFYGIRRPILIDMVFSPLEEIRDIYSFVRADKTGLTAETTSAMPKGKSCILWGRAAPLINSDGVITGAIESIRDITETKKAEESLRISEERYRSVVNDQTEMIARFTPDGTITFANEAFRSYFVPRMGLAEVTGENVGRIMQIGADEVSADLLGSLTADQSIPDIERLVTGRDKKTYWQHWSIRALFDNEGKPAEYQVVGRDITEKKLAEETIAGSKEYLDQIFSSVKAGIVIIDAKNHEIIDINPAGAAMIGLPKEQITGNTCHRFICPSEAGSCPITDLHNRVDNAERMMITSNGRKIPIIKYVTRTNLNGRECLLETFIDNSERRRAEDAVRESEEKYRELADLLPQMIYELDADFRITYANRHALTMFGITGEDLGRGSHALSFIDPSEHELVKENVQKFINGKSFESHEYTAVKKDGSRFPVIIYSAPIYRSDTLTGFRGVIVDISERKKTEELLRESEQRFRNLIQNASDMIRIIDRKGLIAYSSPSTLRIFGYDPADLTGKDPLDYVHPDDRQCVKDALAKVFSQTNPGTPTEYRIRHADGRYIDVETIASNLLEIPGIEGIVTTTRAITERKAAEEKIHEREEKFRALVEHSLDGILISDFSGTLLFANRAAGLMVDAPDYEAMIGKRNVMEFIAPESQADVRRDFSTVAQGSDRYLASYKIITDAKREIWVESIGKRIPFGNTVAILVSMRDISERKRAEEQVRESENRFATIFRSSPVALTLVSATDGTFIDVNDTFLRNTGYSRHEVVGTMAAALGIFADRTEYKRFSTILRNQQMVQGMEMKCRIKNGEIRTCRFTAGLIMMGGKPHIISSVEDVTERRKVSEALRESEEKLSRLADNAPDMIYRMTLPEGRYEYVSPASVAMTGYTPEEFYADPDLIKRLIHPDWHDYFKKQWEALLENRAPPFYEFQIIDRTGTIRWFNQRNLLVSDDRGKTVAIEGIVTDITRQKNTERELRRSELRSLAVNENAGSWIWEVDSGGMYRYSSPAVNRLLGYRADELVGRMHFYDLFDPAVRDNLKDVALAAFSSKEPFRNFVNLNRHKNGTPVLMSTSATPVFDEDGTFTGYCGVDEDITERSASQSALQAMVRSMVGTTGLDSLRKITENVRSWLDADCVMVGEIQPDRQTVKALSMLLDGKEVDGFSYTLKGTPCEDVAVKGFCHYPDDAVRLFPQARDIVELNIRGYLGTPLRDSRGTVTGILSVLSRKPLRSSPQVQEIMDIIAVKAAAEIERIRIERELEESRLMLARAMDLTDTVNWEFDPRAGLFTFNDRFYVLYGTSAEREGGYQMLPETYIREFVLPEDRDAVAATFDRGTTPADPDEELRMEHRIVRRDGEIRTIVVRVGVSITDGGQRIRVHGANQDITERKRAEESLQQAHKKLHLLSGITRHDISNQLLALNGFVAFLHKKVTDPALETYFSRITRASSQINSMIAFTKEYEKIGVQSPAWHVLKDVVSDAGKGILPGQVNLKNELPAGTEVFTDPLILKVFFNLLDNSIRHGMRVTEIRATCHESGENLVVVWEDNGVGIAADEKELIFERGFGRNTGLGMFLVREILSLTGITITETGKPDAGARFEIVVPKGAWRTRNGGT